MKSLFTLGFAVILHVSMAEAVLHALAPAGNVPETLTLKPLVQTSSNEVRFVDLVAFPTEFTVPAALVICHTPDQGKLRTISAAQIAVLLKRHGFEYKLQGALRVTIIRIARNLSVDDLKPLIESAVLRTNLHARVGEIELQAAIAVGKDHNLKLTKLHFDSAIQKYRAWFIAMSESRKTAFEATVTVDGGDIPVEIDASSVSQRAAQLPILVHRGETALMQLQGAGFSATVPVVCLEDGKETTLLRVRDKTAKRNYRAQVLAKGLLLAVSQEN